MKAMASHCTLKRHPNIGDSAKNNEIAGLKVRAEYTTAFWAGIKISAIAENTGIFASFSRFLFGGFC
jgi:hypothetical protein